MVNGKTVFLQIILKRFSPECKITEIIRKCFCLRMVSLLQSFECFYRSTAQLWESFENDFPFEGKILRSIYEGNYCAGQN